MHGQAVTAVLAVRLYGNIAEMNPLAVWYARLSPDEFMKALPKVRRQRTRERLDKAFARDGSEVDSRGSLAGKSESRIDGLNVDANHILHRALC